MAYAIMMNDYSPLWFGAAHMLPRINISNVIFVSMGYMDESRLTL